MQGNYVGDTVDGVNHGQGRLSWSNGDWYEGEFRRGMRHGYGKMAEQNGKKVYEGLCCFRLEDR